jgi:hypothetical protein
MAAAGSFAPARVRSDPGNKRPGKLQWRERKGYWGSIGDSTSRKGSSSCGFNGRAAAHTRGQAGLFMGGEGKGGSHRVKSSTRPRYGHGMAVRTDGVQRRRHWAGGGMVGATSPVRAWRKRREPGRRFGTGGPTARDPADGSRPRRPGPANGAGARSGARRRATSRRSAFGRGNISGLPCSTAVFSRKLN